MHQAGPKSGVRVVGESKRKIKVFALKHPICCLCGTFPTVTRDHLPPRSVFINKAFPEEFIFPACEKCNVGTSVEDQIFVSLNLVFGFPDGGLPIDDMKRVVRGINHGVPQPLKDKLLSFLNPSVLPDVGESLSFELDTQMKAALSKIARKIAKAMHYKKTGGILKKGAILCAHVIPNSKFMDKSTQELFNLFPDLKDPHACTSVIGSQFIHGSKQVEGGSVIAYIFQIHRAVVFLCFISENGSKLPTKLPLEWFDMDEKLIP